MTDVRRDGHHHKDEWPKLTERGWVWADGAITPYSGPQPFDTVERPASDLVGPEGRRMTRAEMRAAAIASAEAELAHQAGAGPDAYLGVDLGVDAVLDLLQQQGSEGAAT